MSEMFDIASFQKALENAQPRFNKKGALKAIGKQYLWHTQVRFAEAKSPYYVPWKELKVRVGGHPLVDTRDFVKSFYTKVVSEDEVVVGTDKEWATTHQFGIKDMVIENAFGTGKTMKVTIPARPFFPQDDDIPAAYARDFESILARFVSAGSR